MEVITPLSTMNSLRKGHTTLDTLFLLACSMFFALAAVYVRGCERL